eukprot:jgi/Picsp_1/3250/NSC_06090-R1_protein
MNSCTKWTWGKWPIVGPSYGLRGLHVSSKCGFLRGSSISFPRKLEQLNYFNCNLTITCATKGSGRSKKKALKGKPGDKLVLPDSRDKAVEQASKALVVAIQSALEHLGAGKGVGSMVTTLYNRLMVDVPVLQDGTDELIELADDLVGGLPEGWRSSIAYILCGTAQIESHKAGECQARGVQYSLGSIDESMDADQGGKSLPKVLLFIKPTISDMAVLERIVERWKEDKIYVLLNAEWSTGNGLASNVHGEFAETFDSAYSFLPILVKAMMVQQLEGAVYKNVSVDDGSGKPWKIFIMRNGGSEQIAQMSRRPSRDAVEASLYNALAISPPRVPNLIKNIFGNN